MIYELDISLILKYYLEIIIPTYPRENDYKMTKKKKKIYDIPSFQFAFAILFVSSPLRIIQIILILGMDYLFFQHHWQIFMGEDAGQQAFSFAV